MPSTLLLDSTTAFRCVNATSLLGELKAALVQAPSQSWELPVRTHSASPGLVHVTGAKGELLAIVEFSRLRALQSALLGAIAVDALSPAAARTVALLGASSEASLQLKTLRLVRSLSQVFIHDPDEEAAASLASRLFLSLSLPCEVARTPQDAVARADIVVITQDGAWDLAPETLSPECHVNALQSPSSVPAALLSSSRVFSDVLSQDSAWARSNAVSSLAEVFGLGWRRPEGRTVFGLSHSSLLDAITAWHVLQAAKDQAAATFDFSA
jgi:ornithine cyclodeaminase/alanine dehydrogenase-like protein (mu-crystallin family)